MPSKNSTRLEDQIDAALADLEVTSEEHDAQEAERRKRWRRSLLDTMTEQATSLDQIGPEGEEKTQPARKPPRRRMPL